MGKSLYNCIALYDYSPDQCDLKEWFGYMEQWAEDIDVHWKSIGLGTSLRLMQFKNGRKKIERNNFTDPFGVVLMGGVREAGTNTDWKTYSDISTKEREGLRETATLCFSHKFIPFSKEKLITPLRFLLKFSNFKYGICYQRPYNMGPADYASGALGGIDLPREEESKIGSWNRKYCFADGDYKTGLLRDVYPFNILIDEHLNQTVGATTLREWIKSDPAHGTLDKLTDVHWLWSIDSNNILKAQETLQKAGLLLCYKP